MELTLVLTTPLATPGRTRPASSVLLLHNIPSRTPPGPSASAFVLRVVVAGQLGVGRRIHLKIRALLRGLQ
jgi:hypothetical protein